MTRVSYALVCANHIPRRQSQYGFSPFIVVFRWRINGAATATVILQVLLALWEGTDGTDVLELHRSARICTPVRLEKFLF